MRWLILAFGLMAFTPIYTEHKTARQIDEEIQNIELNLQPQEFTILPSTPNLQDLKDGQIVIIASMTYTKIMFRQNQEIYSINVSCVTVRR